MKKIDLNSIIESSGLDRKGVAQELFPDNKYPELAMNRILRGEALLDSDQIQKLSGLARMEISELFEGRPWVQSHGPGILKFLSDGYRVEIDQSTWTARLFHGDSLVWEDLLTFPSIPLTDFLNSINIRIAKLEFKPNFKAD